MRRIAAVFTAQNAENILCTSGNTKRGPNFLIDGRSAAYTLALFKAYNGGSAFPGWATFHSLVRKSDFYSLPNFLSKVRLHIFPSFYSFLGKLNKLTFPRFLDLASQVAFSTFLTQRFSRSLGDYIPNEVCSGIPL